MRENAPAPSAVAFLCAAVFLNAGLLEFAGYRYQLASILPWLCAVLLFYGAFLAFGVFRAVQRIGGKHSFDIHTTVGLLFGKAPAALFRLVLTPAWLAAWFAINTYCALSALMFAAFDKAPLLAGDDWRKGLAVSIVWLLMIAPAASGSAGALARGAGFLAKVSFAAILGLALSSSEYLPETIAQIEDPYELDLLALEAEFLLWGAPPLIFASRLLKLPARRDLWLVMIIGIIAPVLIAGLAAICTNAGAAALRVGFWKLPSYLNYANAEPLRLGWGKVLVLAFTFVTAARFAVHLAMSSLRLRRGIGPALLLTAVLILLTHVLWRADWVYRAWTYAAIPFAPLAGAISGAVGGSRRPPFRAGEKRWHTLAWFAGCVASTTPANLTVEGFLPPEIMPILGWVVAYAVARIRRCISEQANRLPGYTTCSSPDVRRSFRT